MEQPRPFSGLQVALLTTKRKRKVVVSCYRCAGARYTILHSHGNATDLGAMHDRYVGLVQNLRVNVVAYDYTGYGASQGYDCGILIMYIYANPAACV
jgi:abhydrolase domain-containing protein 17